MKCSAHLTFLIVALASACARAPKSETFEARKRLTREMIARSEWNTAFSYAQSLHDERPGDPEALTLRGLIYRERDLPAEAEADLRAAIAADSDRAEPHAALAILLDHQRRPDEADQHHRRATKLEPRNAAYLNNHAFSLFLRRRYRDAIELYGQAVRLDPTNPRLRTNHGFALAAAGDFPRAAREFEMGGTRAEARNNLGFAYEQKGDLKSAYELYLEALRIDPASERARSNLVHVASKLGKPLPVEAVAPPPEPSGTPSSSKRKDTAKGSP